MITLDPIRELITLAHTQRGSDLLRDRRLALAGDLTRDHG
jgi:hypothetical protein